MFNLATDKRYLQIAFNNDMKMVDRLLPKIPFSERILIEAGTPFIKKYGLEGIRRIKSIWPGMVVADIKTVDGAEQEVEEAFAAGASAATVIGNASRETIDLFIAKCNELKMDSMIDMINVEKVMSILWRLKKPPSVVVIHRGRDEENSFGALIEYKQLVKVKGKYDVLVSAAGGVDLREAASAVFNGADIVVVNLVTPDDPWKGISIDENISEIANQFLQTIE